jgi:hypothetical protein
MRTGAHNPAADALNMISGYAGCVAKPATKKSRKMRVVAKAAGVGDHAQRLACLHGCAAFDKTRSVIQAQ